MGRLGGGQREWGREAPESIGLLFFFFFFFNTGIFPSEVFREDGNADTEWRFGCILAHWLKPSGQHPWVLSKLCYPSAELMAGSVQVFPLQSKPGWAVSTRTAASFGWREAGKCFYRHEALEKMLEGEEKDKVELEIWWHSEGTQKWSDLAYFSRSRG